MVRASQVEELGGSVARHVGAHADVPPLPWTGERFIPREGGPEIYYEHAHRYLLARSVAAGMGVVDLASGEGYGAAWLAGVADRVVGVDIDPASVQHAEARYARFSNLRFLVGDIHALPLADASVDIVTCFEAIEHVQDPRRVVEEVARILKPGGTLLVSTPNKAVYTDAREYTNEFHVHEFYLQELRLLLREHFADYESLGQRLVAGSVTWRLADATRAEEEGRNNGRLLVSPGFHEAGDGEAPPMPEPMYVVAACRLAGGSEVRTHLPELSVLVDPEELLLDDYRGGIDPVAAEKLVSKLHEQDTQLELVRAQLEQAQAQLEDYDAALTARISELEVMPSLGEQQRLTARLAQDLEAAAELNTRLLAELDAQQRAIVNLQLEASSAAEPGPVRGSDHWVGLLLGGARRLARWR